MTTNMAVVGDKETVNGFRIAGVHPKDNELMTVDSNTSRQEVESFIIRNLCNKKTGILFICDFVADAFKEQLSDHKEDSPTIMVIPGSRSNLRVKE